MRISSIPASELFEHFREAFAWQWLAGPANRQGAVLDGSRFAAGVGAGVNMVGYLNYIHPTRVQVIGAPEAAYLDRGTPQDTERRIRRILELRPPLVVLADGQPATEVLIRAANEHGVLLFATQASASYVVDMLYTYLTKCFAEMTSMHGVFMDILGIGVLLTGDSGLGKSELGLELISRGHGLVADDVVDLSRINQNTIMGSSPELLRNMLEVRGIGLLDVRTILGETAVRRKMRLRLIVHLVSQQIMERDCERLPVTPLTQDVLGLPVDKVIIQVGAGRNLAVLVEAAVRNFLLRLRGVDTHGEFMQRQRKAMEGQ